MIIDIWHNFIISYLISVQPIKMAYDVTKIEQMKLLEYCYTNNQLTYNLIIPYAFEYRDHAINSNTSP